MTVAGQVLVWKSERIGERFKVGSFEFSVARAFRDVCKNFGACCSCVGSSFIESGCWEFRHGFEGLGFRSIIRNRQWRVGEECGVGRPHSELVRARSVAAFWKNFRVLVVRDWFQGCREGGDTVPRGRRDGAVFAVRGHRGVDCAREIHAKSTRGATRLDSVSRHAEDSGSGSG